MTSEKWMTISPADKNTFSGYLALPPAGTGPGLVLIQEIWGVNDHIRAVAEQYALDGFVVLAPDVFWRQQTRTNLSYTEAGTAKAFELMKSTDFRQATEDVVTAIEHLRGLACLVSAWAGSWPIGPPPAASQTPLSAITVAEFKTIWTWPGR